MKKSSATTNGLRAIFLGLFVIIQVKVSRKVVVFFEKLRLKFSTVWISLILTSLIITTNLVVLLWLFFSVEILSYFSLRTFLIVLVLYKVYYSINVINVIIFTFKFVKSESIYPFVIKFWISNVIICCIILTFYFINIFWFPISF